MSTAVFYDSNLTRN